jgi:hypothetical protein
LELKNDILGHKDLCGIEYFSKFRKNKHFRENLENIVQCDSWAFSRILAKFGRNGGNVVFSLKGIKAF